MVAEVLEALALQPGDRVVDGTAGLGGHTRALAETIGMDGEVVAFERDPLTFSRLLESLRDLPQVRPIHDSFHRMLQYVPPASARGVLLDLGLSSFLLEAGGRGFSFRKPEEVLDMRFNPEEGEPLYRRWRELYPEKLAEILEKYGEIRRALPLAQAIFARKPRTVGDLNDVILTYAPRAGVSLLQKVYQALRIWLNQELDILQMGLCAAWSVLVPGGRLAVLSYHSLEDRLVKCVRHLPGARVLYPRGRTPRPEEIAENPRARSARLRAFGKESKDAVAVDVCLRILAGCAHPGQ